jgi:NADH-quinone oxidoreductase subunit H
LPEAESELGGGYFTEYSGMKFAMFMFSEYVEVVTSSMLLVTIFLGGWQLPFLHRDGLTIAIGDHVMFMQRLPHVWVVIFGVLAFFGKTIMVCLLQAVVRWSLPRFRYDQLMKVGWRGLLPAALANIAVTGVVWLAIDGAGSELEKTLKVVADVTQGVTALAVTVFFAWIFVGLFFGERQRLSTVLGSAAERAFKKGGTRTEPMQA